MPLNLAAVEYFLITLNQILTAGIAITAFALLLYTTQFNLKDRVARTFALILICMLIVFSTDAIGSVSDPPWQVDIFLRLEWIGIILLPATYFHFSDALLTTTGKPSRWKRYWAVRATYLISFLFLAVLPFSSIFGNVYLDQPSAPQFEATFVTLSFSLFYLVVMGMAGFNFVRAYRRTTTPTSHRRIIYLIFGAIAPGVGAFPFMLFGAGLAQRYTVIFWAGAVFSNLLVGTLLVIMAYSVAFFGVAWPDRVVKTRLFQWLLRGPGTASLTLAVMTIVRRAGAVVGNPYSAFVPIAMVVTVLVSQFAITLFAPLFEKWLFLGKDRSDVTQLRTFEEKFLTNNDLTQFLELILSAICDLLQSPGGFVAILQDGKVERVISVGKNRYHNEDISDDLLRNIPAQDDSRDLFEWGNDLVLPLSRELDGEKRMLGLVVITRAGGQPIEEDQLNLLHLYSRRVAFILLDRLRQNKLFEGFQTLQSDMEMVQRLRAVGRFDESRLLLDQADLPADDMAQWVKEALTHYWGGPRLTQSPLMKLKIVKEAINEHNGSYTNALRSILHQAIDRIRPEGDRRFTAEWILYNILEMKFVEGRKVRDIAARLAMSEADLYRKQRVAVETIVREITIMEIDARNGLG